MLFPAKDLIFFQADIHGNQLVRERVKVLRRMPALSASYISGAETPFRTPPPSS